MSERLTLLSGTKSGQFNHKHNQVRDRNIHELSLRYLANFYLYAQLEPNLDSSIINITTLETEIFMSYRYVI